MSEVDDKQRKQKIQESLEDLTEATSRRVTDEEEIERAEENRARAEKELVDSRTPSNTGRND